jgi:hypothetical protein
MTEYVTAMGAVVATLMNVTLDLPAGVVPFNQTIYQFDAVDIDNRMWSMNKYR